MVVITGRITPKDGPPENSIVWKEGIFLTSLISKIATSRGRDANKV